MFWIALSAMIMSLTGSGDDTFVIRKFLGRVHDAVEKEVPDPGRRSQAIQTLARVSAAFAKHRKRVGEISKCLERADRAYTVGATNYQRCLVDARPAWDAAAEELITLDREFRAELTPAEYAAIRQRARR
jgi:hypothetical protein